MIIENKRREANILLQISRKLKPSDVYRKRVQGKDVQNVDFDNIFQGILLKSIKPSAL